ncbi:WD repeat-containing protein 90 [Phytophthora cinnamomi]|uniref:WD repeat-containing protein 90 n=1 Tax=Phytophthora cinnamomi TaxID=4785 RepID=UPI003559F1B3|nr:WD repeat-containing protein 90 [Phytophthora cinnamomi]
MASPFDSTVMPVWQDPFVEVIKFGMTHRNVGWHAQGDVEQIQDQHIHKNVFRIRGAIAATNYLRVPRDAAKGTHGLGLTGRYAYIQLRRIGDLPMTIHLDFVTNKKTALRFTLSSIYELFRSTGTVLRVPLSLDARWTVVVIDMVALLEFHSFNQYARETYRHLKTITLCASMNVRNFFVSPTLYTPTTLSSTLRFPGDFGDQYCWLAVPSGANSPVNHGTHRRLDPVKQEDLRIAATPTPASQSMVMAAYSDGSFRVFDLREMRLLSRFELTPSIAKSARYDGGSFDRITFVGAFTALIMTKDNCVLLVDISNALQLTEEAPSARGTNIRPALPKRVNARPTKKTALKNSRPSPKPRARARGGRREGREVVYRELTLLPSSYRRRKRLPGLAKSEEVHVEVGAIEVMASGDAKIHPFLIVVKYTGPARYGEGRCVAKVFAEPAMSVLAEEEIAPTDEWRLHTRCELDRSTAVFTADSTTGTVRVLYPSQHRPTEGPGAWSLELRECVQRRVIQRLVFDASNFYLGQPVQLRCIHAALSPETPEAAEVVLLSDANGHVALLHLSTQQLVPINSRTAESLRLTFHSTSILCTDSNPPLLLLSSPSQLAVASLSFH